MEKNVVQLVWHFSSPWVTEYLSFSCISRKIIVSSIFQMTCLTLKRPLRQPCFFNYFAATNVTGFSETLSLAENFLSLGRKSLNLAEKFLNLEESGWVWFKKMACCWQKLWFVLIWQLFQSYYSQNFLKTWV